MIRTSFLSKNILNTRYLVNHKKPAVQLPSHKPPKYIYKIKYHPTAPPTFDQQYRDHAHMNEFGQVAQNQFELYRFSYSGQWWYIGSIFPKLLVIAFPFIIFFELKRQDQKRLKAGKPTFSTWQHIPDINNPSRVVAYDL